MQIPFSTLALLAGLFTGSMGAYFAYKRGRNPYIWFSLGFFFGLIGAFLVFLAPKLKKQAPPEAPPKEKLGIHGPKDKFWYYLDPAHQQIGPMSLDALNLALTQEKISLKTYVWNEELPEWKLLTELIPNITNNVHFG